MYIGTYLKSYIFIVDNLGTTLFSHKGIQKPGIKGKFLSHSNRIHFGTFLLQSTSKYYLPTTRKATWFTWYAICQLGSEVANNMVIQDTVVTW